MLNNLLRTALLGTAKQPMASAEHPAEVLAARVAVDSAERSLLLRAGASLSYHLAGYAPESVADAPPPAPDDERPVCPPAAADILGKIFEHPQEELLLEALERLDRAGIRLPAEMLPRALDKWKAEWPQPLAAVLGERGHWLAQFREKWRVGRQAGKPDLPDDAETIWSEGKLFVRKMVLSQIRRIDAERGRQWLADVWDKEKAETRAELVEILRTGLSPADEAFLNDALDDASKRVRATAADLLSRLPGSALSARLRALGETMLRREKKITVTPPPAFKKEWEKDGLQEKPPDGTGRREFWLTQVMERIPPDHWATRLEATPSRLIEAVSGQEFGLPLLSAWSHAAARFEQADWNAPLWDFWYQFRPKKGQKKETETAAEWLAVLSAEQEPSEIERRALLLVEDGTWSEKFPLSAIVNTDFPCPWSEPFALRILSLLREALTRLAKRSSPELYNYTSALARAGVYLPESCFEPALEPWPLPETSDYYIYQFNQAIEQFLDTIRLRRDFIRQIPYPNRR